MSHYAAEDNERERRYQDRWTSIESFQNLQNHRRLSEWHTDILGSHAYGSPNTVSSDTARHRSAQPAETSENRHYSWSTRDTRTGATGVTNNYIVRGSSRQRIGPATTSQTSARASSWQATQSAGTESHLGQEGTRPSTPASVFESRHDVVHRPVDTYCVSCSTLNPGYSGPRNRLVLRGDRVRPESFAEEIQASIARP